MTLTELSFYSRRMAPFLVIIFLVLLIFFYAIRLFLVFLQVNKPVRVVTNTVFGNIKRPFIKDASTSANLNFTLDTIEGQPITATDAARVYFLPPAYSGFKFLQQIYLMAKTVGFDTEVTKHRLDDTVAVFEDERQVLTIDISNFNFTYNFKFQNDPLIVQNAFVPQKGVAQERATEYLRTIGRYPEELAKGKTNIVYLAYNQQQNQMTVLQDSVGANMVEVDFYRPDIDGFPAVSPNYFNSQNYVLLTFYNDGSFKVLRSQVQAFEKSEEQVGIYPLITGDVAFESLKTGKGIVASVAENQKDIVVKKMFLGYLDPGVYQEYLQPVYVFLGDNNFVGYVPAVTEQYLSQ